MGTNLSAPHSRQYATTFTIGAKTYLGLRDNGGTSDFWEYDPATNLWTEKANFPGDARAYAIAFSIGNKGYVGAGDGIGFSSLF
jgi:N-acetylneuraminic acid mutarotase